MENAISRTILFPEALWIGITKQAEKEGGLSRASWIRQACAEKLRHEAGA